MIQSDRTFDKNFLIPLRNNLPNKRQVKSQINTEL